MNFAPVGQNDICEGFCLIKSVEKKITAKGLSYLDAIFSDSSGEISAKLWDYNEIIHGNYETGDLVKVRGITSKYNGVDQFKVEKIRKVSDDDNVSPSDFIKTAEYNGETMFNELIFTAEQFDDADLKNITTYILKKNREQLLTIPAAFKLHHAIRGGLLFHTLSIVKLALGVCKIYPFIDRDLLLSGAILHDISKIDEFVLTKSGIVSGYTAKGNLIGHLAMGAIEISKAADELNISQEKSMLLQHMVLSHHGDPEFGAAVRPSFVEADLLSQLDSMDARVYEMIEATDATSVGDFSQRLWALDNRKLYNHGRLKDGRSINLFD